MCSHNLIIIIAEICKSDINNFSFKKLCSTITQLIDSYSHWSRAINDGSSVDVTYLDCGKAFNSVVHSKLFLKL